MAPGFGFRLLMPLVGAVSVQWGEVGQKLHCRVPEEWESGKWRQQDHQLFRIAWP